MPPKPPLDDNTRFLWQCLYNSDYKNIDFPGVAKFFGLNTPAARMRFSRLKKQLEQEAASDNEDYPTRREPVVQSRKRKRSKKDGNAAVKRERGEESAGDEPMANIKREREEGAVGAVAMVGAVVLGEESEAQRIKLEQALEEALVKVKAETQE